MAKDPYRYFRIEASELLDQLAKNVLNLEKGSAGAELVMHLLRLAHTLKGAARVVRQAEIADLAHSIEDALAPHRDGALAVPRERVDSVLGALDAIAGKIAQLPQPENVEALPAAVAAPAAVVRIVRADVAEVDMLLEGLGEIGNELAGVRRALASVERIRDLAAQVSQKNGLSSTQVKSMTAEMHVLVVAAERNMSAGVERIDRELREARDAAERLRLVPAASVFNALERTVRDAAHSTGKQVIFEASGGEIRIDGQVLDTVQSALIQLVRNAVAHGIEAEEQRKKAGKPAVGRITLEVARRGYRAWFRCRDDGGGVDLEAVRRVLKKRGGVTADIERLDASALLALLLKGGITTTSVVTELAGRGVGLDLVRESMQRLNGEVVVYTEQGGGTSIELSVPLSLAALDVLMVETDGEVVALPLDAVRRTLRVAPEDVSRSPKGDAIIYDDKQIPFMQLQLGIQQNKANVQSTRKSSVVTAVVIAAADTIAALSVDRLCGMDTIVLRPLPGSAPADPIVMGVYLDNEGNPRIVLDPEQLVTRQRAASAESPTQISQQQASSPILIIDDSLTTRMLESSILESAGFAVETAASAEEGLDMAYRNAYSLFLVDVEMPGMDGFSFVEHTRTDPALRGVPCILVTSRNAPEDRQRGITSGASAYIVKGEFDQVEFLERVTNLVQR
jgi:two-component system chemotaxis sensor kinase CheA